MSEIIGGTAFGRCIVPGIFPAFVEFFRHPAMRVWAAVRGREEICPARMEGFCYGVIFPAQFHHIRQSQNPAVPMAFCFIYIYRVFRKIKVGPLQGPCFLRPHSRSELEPEDYRNRIFEQGAVVRMRITVCRPEK